MNILGKHILLRDESREGDDDDLFRWLNMEEWNYYDEPDKPFKGIHREAFQKRLEERRRQRGKPPTDKHSWQIDTVEGQHIGWINYYSLDRRSKQAYIGICIPEENIWGKGYGTEAVRLLVNHLFDELALNEVRTVTWTGNERMMGCAGKAGFTEIMRSPHRAGYSVRGEPLERIELSLSREAWLAQRAKD